MADVQRLELTWDELDEIKWGNYPDEFKGVCFVSCSQYGHGLEVTSEREQGALVVITGPYVLHCGAGAQGIYTAPMEVKARILLKSDKKRASSDAL